ncbi:MAG: DUF1513 domain-containing protein [Gammaproteobacteria bacterium]|nr:DUF1513 domain-containing protein [Gammaproteobacteria bacterium]
MNLGITRRGFLGVLCALPLLPLQASASRQRGQVFVNGHIDRNNTHHISGFDSNGTEFFRHALPDKAHGFAVNPSHPGQIAALPSLPGTQAPVFDLNSGQQIALMTSRPGRHFNGHGCFSHDGRYLYTSENIAANAQGVIGVRDGRTFRLLRELPGHGIGPHDIRILPDDRTLVVASGGIQTHPDSGKRELNINTMQSALLYIDSRDGRLLARHQLPVDQLSIRHFDVGSDGTVLVACQYKGNSKLPALVGVQRGATGIEMLEIDDDDLWPLKQYCADARIAGNGVGAVSCPRGNRLTLWNLTEKRFIKAIEIKDVGGLEVSLGGNAFIASANTGELYRIDATSLTSRRIGTTWNGAKWTNHMVSSDV